MEFISTFIVIILFVIGILFIVCGIRFKHKSFSLINKCTNSCDGILIKIEEIKINQRVNGDGRKYTRKSYVPIYEYKVQENKYTIKGTNGSGFKIGDVEKINYNPENPEQCYIEGYSFAAWKILLIIGIVILVMSIGFFGLSKLIFS